MTKCSKAVIGWVRCADVASSTHKFYYETRFMFAFVFIGLFFAACALILGVLALCSKIASFLDSALISVALFFQSITAALMT